MNVKPQEIISFISNGNEDAEKLLWALFNYVHVLDDIADKDAPLSADMLCNASLDFMYQLSFNPFYIHHKCTIGSFFINAWQCWKDATQWEHSGNLTLARDSDVLKSFYHEIFYHVAFLVGGIKHFQEVVSRFREYDHDNLTESEV